MEIIAITLRLLFFFRLVDNVIKVHNIANTLAIDQNFVET